MESITLKFKGKEASLQNHKKYFVFITSTLSDPLFKTNLLEIFTSLENGKAKHCQC